MTPKNTKNARPTNVRLSVEMLSKNGKPECLRTITTEGIPIWSTARIIDGALYALDSTHPDAKTAEKRQDQLRAEGRTAQYYEYARPKLVPSGNGTFKPARAVVYALPFRGAKGRIENNKLVFDAAPKKQTREARAKAPKKTVRGKSGVRVRATPKKPLSEAAIESRAAEVANNLQG